MSPTVISHSKFCRKLFAGLHFSAKFVLLNPDIAFRFPDSGMLHEILEKSNCLNAPYLSGLGQTCYKICDRCQLRSYNNDGCSCWRAVCSTSPIFLQYKYKYTLYIRCF
jgi:hypothetical protein